MNNAPCKNCSMKGCGAYHSKCDKYLNFRRECEVEHRMRRIEADISGYRRDCVKPKKRRKVNERN